jgi:iron-sulfur cluster assembly accessory protein
VKISLTKKGCNGLSYAMNYVKSAGKFDEVVNREKFKVIIDSKALMALVGTEMDYVENELGSEFVFNNPN